MDPFVLGHLLAEPIKEPTHIKNIKYKFTHISGGQGPLREAVNDWWNDWINNCWSIERQHF